MSTALQPVPENGLVLGRYKPLRPLGTGGSGSVWLVHDEKYGRDVALKIIGKEGKAASRAEREAHSAARLRHPHCLRAFGFASDARHVYIPYEYVPGHTLRHALRAGELDDEGVVEAAAQVLEALAHAHAHGIVHRDVKPSNVLLADGDEVSVRLFDFGLAQLADAETLTAAGDVPGTLAYIPPERLQGKSAGPAADVWAVGVLLWEALSGRHPFWRASPMEMGKQIQSGAASLATVRPDLSRRLVAAVDRALAVNPEKRPTAAALARALRGTRREIVERPLRPAHLRLDRRLPARVGAPVLAGLAVAWVAASLPFYPPRWPLLLGALAAGLMALRPRIGLAFALAVPIFPLGNVALGLAVVYAVAATAWLGLAWPRPRSGLVFALGAVLAPLAAIGLLPLALQRVDGWFRRAAYALRGRAGDGLRRCGAARRDRERGVPPRRGRVALGIAHGAARAPAGGARAGGGGCPPARCTPLGRAGDRGARSRVAGRNVARSAERLRGFVRRHCVDHVCGAGRAMAATGRRPWPARTCTVSARFCAPHVRFSWVG